MIREAALVTLICVLFVQMGLSDAIQDILHVKLRIASCPKCLTMWATLACLLLHGNRVLESVAASFICAYTALWLAMAYDAMALIYNKLYGKITETTSAAQETDPEPSEAGDPDAVHKM